MQNLQELQSNYQKKQNRKWMILLMFFFLFLVVLYFLFSELFPRIAIKFVSTKQEIALGEQVYQSMLREKKINTMATMQLQSFADHLQLSSQYPIKVTVVDEEEVNAFALPGGHIIVHTAILKKLRSSDALVALLSHETIHINHRHSLQNILSSMSTGFLLSFITRGGGGFTQLILGNANLLRELSYTRKLEKEADESGMKLMAKNAVSLKGMLQLMETLQEVDEENSLPAISFLSTHPLTEERIAGAKKFIDLHEVDTVGKEESLEAIWKVLKTSLNRTN